MSRFFRLSSLMLIMMMVFAPSAWIEADAEEETPSVPFNDFFYNPFLSTANDPWVVKGEDWYYYCFSLSGLHLVRSRTLSGLDAAELQPENNIVMAVGQNQTDIWAPELHHYQNHWYIFYAADYNCDNTQHRMYVMRSQTDDPFGKWDAPVKLRLPDDQWAIDGTFFEYEDGRIFLVWSGWESMADASNSKQRLYIAQLETGDPTNVVSTERVLISTPTLDWETVSMPINEGPTVIASPNGTYYCIYSASFSGSDAYAIGAICLNGEPLDKGAWEKLPQPILSSDAERKIYAPGHASFVQSPDETETWMIYHTAKASGAGWVRSGRAQRLMWVNDIPTIENGLADNDALQPMPSGEETNRILICLSDGELNENAVVLSDGSLSLPDVSAKAKVYVTAEKAGQYAIYIRHTAKQWQDNTALRITVNGNKRFTTNASRSEAGQFVIDRLLVTLTEGLNTLTLQVNHETEFDVLVFDKTPY